MPEIDAFYCFSNFITLYLDIQISPACVSVRVHTLCLNVPYGCVRVCVCTSECVYALSLPLDLYNDLLRVIWYSFSFTSSCYFIFLIESDIAQHTGQKQSMAHMPETRCVQKHNLFLFSLFSLLFSLFSLLFSLFSFLFSLSLSSYCFSLITLLSSNLRTSLTNRFWKSVCNGLTASCTSTFTNAAKPCAWPPANLYRSFHLLVPIQQQ